MTAWMKSWIMLDDLKPHSSYIIFLTTYDTSSVEKFVSVQQEQEINNCCSWLLKINYCWIRMESTVLPAGWKWKWAYRLEVLKFTHRVEAWLSVSRMESDNLPAGMRSENMPVGWDSENICPLVGFLKICLLDVSLKTSQGAWSPKMCKLYLADPDKARGCSRNTAVHLLCHLLILFFSFVYGAAEPQQCDITQRVIQFYMLHSEPAYCAKWWS